MTDSGRAAAEQTAGTLAAAIDAAGDPVDAEFLQRFFKTGPGQYGEGDVFVGVRVPTTRAIVKGFERMPLAEASALLESPVHEHRLAALIVMVRRFEVASRPRTRDDEMRGALHAAYLDAVRAGHVNNWDLVDASAEYLVGEYLRSGDGDLTLLDRLAASDALWERRVAVLATFAFIKAGDAGPILRLAPRLLADREDLMHKAVGWMLRETGKRVDRDVLTGFLDEYAARMPRTMLSYATEHLSPEERAFYRSLR
ncbi:DNA alkylation repair protein [Agromyces sp. Leaf222]|uniref:DNA alkylation repair protein n=1 Tax=Agromyces sp. Leaf222 TaxID=1735688 RepID=UPI0006F7667B|nr:DNA alkylation repair protein [Agromyces sp. Leaf222]KQM80993.1 DNA alkylation repair protein [Agromyces sp. Leaf222]